MKQLKWLLTLADGKPLLFSLAILMIAVGTLAVVVKNRDAKIDACNMEKELARLRYEQKADSLFYYYRTKEAELNAKVENTLKDIIANYKEQVEEQKELNQKINTTIDNTKKLINKNRTQIKKLN